MARFDTDTPSWLTKLRAEQEQRKQALQDKRFNDALEWADNIGASDDYVVLDTESCGGTKTDEIISLGIVRAKDGKQLFYSLVKPSADVKFNYFATKVHGIKEKDLVGQPSFGEIWKEIEPILASNIILAYNYSADKRMIEQTAVKWDIGLPLIGWDCVMLKYKHYKRESKAVSLTQACNEMAVKSGGHNALEDALATARVIYRMRQRYGIKG